MGHQFKAFDARGHLMMHTYTLSPCAFAAERAAYQSCVNKGQFAYVQVTEDDETETDILHPCSFASQPPTSARVYLAMAKDRSGVPRS